MELYGHIKEDLHNFMYVKDDEVYLRLKDNDQLQKVNFNNSNIEGEIRDDERLKRLLINYHNCKPSSSYDNAVKIRMREQIINYIKYLAQNLDTDPKEILHKIYEIYHFSL